MEKINDMRGSLFTANFIQIENNKPYYCGMPIETIEKSSGMPYSNHYYDIFGLCGFNIGMISLTDQDKEKLYTIIRDRKNNK